MNDVPVPSIPRVDVLGIPVAATSPASALEIVTGWIDRGEHRYATFTGVHGLMEAQRDGAVLAAHHAAGLVAADGMPLVWAARHAGAGDAARIYGPDFALAVCARAADRGWPVYLYGGAPGVAADLGHVLERRCPGLLVAGAHSPPFRPSTPDEDEQIVAEINRSGAQIVLVGLSTPLQERWMADHVRALEAKVLLGVGAAFDQLTGRTRRAPRWMQRTGLEWAFRLATEPRRLWRRYLRNNPAFLLAIARRRPRLTDPLPVAHPGPDPGRT